MTTGRRVMYSIVLVLVVSPLLVAGWGETYQKARLRDVQVLTLREGAMTTGRRSSPVPQLACVGGSGRGRGEPGVVQCYNRGWDGREVQWECKADMEGSVRFGKVEVVCEGYDYPEDEYILAGSCGLEYTLELTKEGRQQDSYGGGGGWGYQNQKTSYSYENSNKWSGLGDLIMLCVVVAGDIRIRRQATAMRTATSGQGLGTLSCCVWWGWLSMPSTKHVLTVTAWRIGR